ncbi:MAG: hypothetical protein JWN08_625 [Frankiales bacterium]|jgi:hypothetical protein|nr:hypothetical protein [Frankiales bacterium]
MSLSDVDRLRRLAEGINGASGPEEVVARAVAALTVLRRLEAGFCSDRDGAICALHRSGESLQRIRERTGLSRARIHQIVQAAGQG